MDYVSIIRSAVIQILILSSPFLIVSVVLGLVLAILQASTSIQDQSLSFVPKIIVILLIVFFFGGLLFGLLQAYTSGLLEQISQVNK